MINLFGNFGSFSLSFRHHYQGVLGASSAYGGSLLVIRRIESDIWVVEEICLSWNHMVVCHFRRLQFNVNMSKWLICWNSTQKYLLNRISCGPNYRQISPESIIYIISCIRYNFPTNISRKSGICVTCRYFLKSVYIVMRRFIVIFEISQFVPLRVLY